MSDPVVLIGEILTLGIQLVIVVAGGAAVRWLRARASQVQIDTAREVASVAAEAVEQVAGRLGFRGKDKLLAAIERARQLAADRGLRLSDQQWENLLEAAVREIQALDRDIGGKVGG